MTDQPQILLEADEDNPFRYSAAAEELEAASSWGPETEEFDDPFGELEAGLAELQSLRSRVLPKARPEPVRRTLQSIDLDVRLCVHELSAALAIFAGVDPVAAEIPLEYQNAAARVLELVAQFPKCQQKGHR